MGIEKPDFHAIAKERQELKGDLLERSGKTWQEHKKSWKKEDGFLGVAEAVETGNIFEFVAGKDDAKEDPDSHIKIKLGELDEKAKEFSFKDKKQVASVKEAREVERKQNEVFEIISRELSVLEKMEEAGLRAEFSIVQRSRGEFSEADKERLRQVAGVKKAIEKRKQVLRESPETYLFFRMREFKHAREEMTEFGFVALESHQKNMRWIRERWEEGNPVLLEGPTGTGKTELLNYMTRKLYRANPELLRCTERTGPGDIFGKMLLCAAGSMTSERIDIINQDIEDKLEQWTERNPNTSEKEFHAANERFLRLAILGLEGTETFFQPGRYTTAIDRGVPLLMDEFNQLPTNMRFALKELYNRKAGAEIVVQEDTGKPHQIQNGFAWGATANIKSGKHKERFDLDGAESRVFEMRRIDYLPDYELYDLALVSLMDKKGGVGLSLNEAKVILKNLINAAAGPAGIQKGYSDELENHYGMTGGRGEKPSLEKAVLDPGTVLRIVSGYKTKAAEGAGFLAYLDERLMDFVSKGDYPEKDRELMIRILMSNGFFQNVEARQFKIKGLNEEKLKPFRSVEEKKGELMDKKYLTLEQLAELDPFGRRAEFFAEAGSDFLKSEQSKKYISEIKELRKQMAALGITFEEALNVPDLEKLNEIIAPFLEDWLGNKAKITPSFQSPQTQDWSTKETDIDPSKFGEYTLNPETQNLDFENAKVIVPDLSQFEAKPASSGNPAKPGAKLSELAKYLVDTYGDKYHIPGIEYLKWLRENPGKNPPGENIKDASKYFFLFGSLLRRSSGRWSAPNASWNGSSWDRNGDWLDIQWSSDCRVVLLEKKIAN